MATSTDVGICNRALLKINAGTITSLTADSTAEDRACNLVYDDLLQETLSLFAWPFATKHANLLLTSGFKEYNSVFDPNAAATPIAVSAITQANPGVVTTATDPSWSSGVIVKFKNVGGMTELLDYFDGIYTLPTVSGTTLTLPVNTTNWSAYTSGGTVTRHQVLGLYDGGYTYDLPSDILIPLRLENKDQDFQIAGSKLLSTIDEAKLIYISTETTVGNFGSLFIELLAFRIAKEIVFEIKGLGEESQILQRSMEVGYERTKSRVQKVMAQQEYDDTTYTDKWLEIRQ